jgi:hypothetical protein
MGIYPSDPTIIVVFGEWWESLTEVEKDEVEFVVL